MHMPISPHGADVLIIVKNAARKDTTEHRGELLEATADGLVVGLQPDSTSDIQMALVPWNIIYSAKAIEAKGIKSRVRVSGQSHDDAVDEFRLVSRYPQGLSNALRAALLASFGQTDVLVVTRQVN